MTSIILVYMLAQLSHLPGLFLIITFGMVLANNKLLENTPIRRYVDFTKFRNDLTAFRKMLNEFTFLARSLFFIIFGYYTQVNGLLSIDNILTSLAITFSLFFMRMIFIKFFLGMPVMPLLLFIPRGLITIILFLSIPLTSRIGLINEQVITLVILITIFMLMAGNILFKKKAIEEESDENKKYTVSEETLRLRELEARKLEETTSLFRLVLHIRQIPFFKIITGFIRCSQEYSDPFCFLILFKKYFDRHGDGN